MYSFQFKCGIVQYIPQERFCLRFNKDRDCSGERERTALCDNTKSCFKAKKQTNCIDIDPVKCQSYRKDLRTYCVTPIYATWMRKNCKKSCGFCPSVGSGNGKTTGKKKTINSCMDVDAMKCQSYKNDLKKFCVDPIHAVWMKNNCKRSCGYCAEQGKMQM